MSGQAVLRLYTLAECHAAQYNAAADPQVCAMLAAAVSQVCSIPLMQCVRCSTQLNGAAAYVSIITPLEDEQIVPNWFAAICVECGSTRSRLELGLCAEGFARMIFGDCAGHG